jgi:purine-binding chemotaxis protein CheW
MDIAKIRKKLKRSGGSKSQKKEGKKNKPSSSGVDETREPVMSSVEVAAQETVTIPEEALPVLYDDDFTEEHVPVMELLSFQVSGQTYAFKVENVQEILRSQPVTPVPGTESFLSGITSVRGSIIPVMDMGRRMIKDVDHDYGKRAKILVVYGPKGSIGVLIESAVKVLLVPVESAEEVPQSLPDEEAHFIEHVVRDGGKLVFIINVDNLFNFSGRVEGR